MSRQWIRLIAGGIFILIPTIAMANNEEQDSPEQDNNVLLQSRQLHFTYDSLLLPKGKGSLQEDEKLGLLGGNYLISFLPDHYLGLGIYGAVSGRRGGFFTGGLKYQWQPQLFRTHYLNIGGFIGGGGGGRAPQGGGLMVRPHFGWQYKINDHRIGIGYSYVWFPNGQILSRQLTLAWGADFQSVFVPGWQPLTARILAEVKALEPLQVTQRTFALHKMVYFPIRGLRDTDGNLTKLPMNLLGINWQQRWQGQWSFEFETSGALGGVTDGFAQIFAGLNYQWDWFSHSRLKTGLLLGSAGGGLVDTGGGVIARGYVGMTYEFSPHWQAEIDVGLTQAIEGDFTATTVLFKIARSYDVVLPDNGWMNQPDKDKFRHLFLQKYRIRSGVQAYYPTVKNIRKDDTRLTEPLNLVTFKMDTFISQATFLTGQALGAFAGDAGGYAAGLIGWGYQYNSHSHPYFPNIEGQLLLGAAGGGAISVGGGVVVQPMLNMNFKVLQPLHLNLGLGYIAALAGELRAVVLDVSINYRLGALHLR